MMVIVIYSVKRVEIIFVRVTRQQAAENRARVVQTASRLLRRDGIAATGVDAVMSGAGLTHGGFYGQFGSKDALVAEAIADAQADTAARLATQSTRAAFVEAYLNIAHRDDPGGGCVLSALSGEGARQSPEVRRALTGCVEAQLNRLTELAAGRADAVTALASLVGAMVLSRVVDDLTLSDEILATVRDAQARPGASAPGPG